MPSWAFRLRRPIVAALAVLALLAVAGIIAAQPPVPHAVMEGEDCLSCHQAGTAGAPRMAWDHLGRSNQDCGHCHQVSGAPAGEIPHPVFGRGDCMSCHRAGVGSAPLLSGNHLDYTNDQCGQCHIPSPAAAEPTPIPTPIHTAVPELGPEAAGVGTCVSCHQHIYADDKHALFTGRPIGDAQNGAVLFAQLCAGCHGEDGTIPVGDENRLINSEAYWGSHDNAAVLRDIGTGSHGQMTAFAQDHGGPLPWEGILDLAASVRLWGPVGELSLERPSAEPTYARSIGPLLTERCGACHGGTAGLTVTDYDSLMAGASSGAAVVPGEPEESRIVEVQRGEHYARLSEVELDLLIEWIGNGASPE